MALDEDPQPGISRRQLIKRSAIVGGTVMWAAPVIQSFTSPAGAVSAPCNCTGLCIELVIQGIVIGHLVCDLDPATCACVCCCAGIPDSCQNCATPDPCAVVPVLVNCSGLLPGPC